MFGELNQSIKLKLIGPPKKMLNLCVLIVLLMNFHFYFKKKTLKRSIKGFMNIFQLYPSLHIWIIKLKISKAFHHFQLYHFILLFGATTFITIVISHEPIKDLHPWITIYIHWIKCEEDLSIFFNAKERFQYTYGVHPH
jgi:hypothetical protein